MSSNDIDIHHLAAAYALDALDERERAAFEAHYPSCEVCRGDVLAFRDATAHLARISSTPPPPSLKASVMAQVAETRQLSPLLSASVSDLDARRRLTRRRTLGGLGIAAAIVLVVAGVLTVGRDDAPTEASAVQAVLDAPDAAMVSLDDASGASGSVMVMWSAEQGRAVVIGDGLAPAPAGRAYEVWLIGAAGPVPMGVLDPAPTGSMHHVMPIDGTPTAWGITLEPSGGSPSPTGPILYQATV